MKADGIWSVDGCYKERQWALKFDDKGSKLHVVRWKRQRVPGVAKRNKKENLVPGPVMIKHKEKLQICCETNKQEYSPQGEPVVYKQTNK